MPEGPEVKRVAKTLDDALKGKILGELWHSEFSLRKPFLPLELKKRQNAKIKSVESYGKVLFFYDEKEPILYAGLGMTGQLLVTEKISKIMPHTHVRWQIKNSSYELRYQDRRRFGIFMPCDNKIKKDILKNLGPDMFNIDKHEIKLVIEKMKNSARVIKDILLDQKVITGVGNIYASECLFLANINPLKKGFEIKENKYKKLIDCVIEVLNLAYKNGGTTFSDYLDGEGKKGQNQNYLKVFMRENEPCFTCKDPILRVKQQGRSTFYCKKCQS